MINAAVYARILHSDPLDIVRAVVNDIVGEALGLSHHIDNVLVTSHVLEIDSMEGAVLSFHLNADISRHLQIVHNLQ